MITRLDGRLFETTGEFREPEAGEWYMGGSGYRFPRQVPENGTVPEGSHFGVERIITRELSTYPCAHCEEPESHGVDV